jgi:hypothetical protein
LPCAATSVPSRRKACTACRRGERLDTWGGLTRFLDDGRIEIDSRRTGSPPTALSFRSAGPLDRIDEAFVFEGANQAVGAEVPFGLLASANEVID